jgi:molybdopterin converting factor small subunit
MQVHIELTAQARQQAGKPSVVVELATGATVQTALHTLATQTLPEVRSFLLDDAGTLRPGLMLIVNGQVCGHADTHVLLNDDRITLLAPLGGG